MNLKLDSIVIKVLALYIAFIGITGWVESGVQHSFSWLQSVTANTINFAFVLILLYCIVFLYWRLILKDRVSTRLDLLGKAFNATAAVLSLMVFFFWYGMTK